MSTPTSNIESICGLHLNLWYKKTINSYIHSIETILRLSSFVLQEKTYITQLHDAQLKDDANLYTFDTISCAMCQSIASFILCPCTVLFMLLFCFENAHEFHGQNITEISEIMANS